MLWAAPATAAPFPGADTAALCMASQRAPGAERRPANAAGSARGSPSEATSEGRRDRRDAAPHGEEAPQDPLVLAAQFIMEEAPDIARGAWEV